MSWKVILPMFVFIILTAAAQIPREIQWTDDTFGPDGPWRGVNVQIGSSPTSISLYPGGTWETWLISDDYCERGTCYASKAGTYDKRTGDRTGLNILVELDGFMQGVNVEGDTSIRYRDDIMFGEINTINSTIALLDAQKIKYPGGQTVPFFAGCLSMGGPKSVNQSFEQPDGRPATNGSMPPGWFWENEYTPSNSYGMHIGSVKPSIAGSLWFGGYDKNRVIGEVLTLSGSPRGDGITLWDIAIEGVGDHSPFTSKSKGDLLAKGNSSISSGLKITVDGCSPYLTLPKSTCDNIAEHLPVNFNSDLGLYIWDTKSDQYDKIVNSATALSFSFISDTNTDPVKIRVPFMHLNLTLSEPIVDNPIPYFPCHVNNNGRYVLGRSFLQDAFVGANWHPDANTWWLAQAPGPRVQATTDVTSIETKDKTISKGGNNWEASWKGVWDDEPTPSPSSTPTKAASPSEQDEVESKPSMPTATKVGIAVGAGAALCLIALGLGIFFWRRRRRAQGQQSETQSSLYKDNSDGFSVKWPSDLPPQEMHVPRHKLPPYEMSADERRIYEMYVHESQQKRPLTQRYELA
ncbi:hypothetical protein FOXG_12896 [Fusarium oxysporum f. sp. lycopersici 4287]|uniref:Peptidase A1 domain-containing protein n=2 Tax=Fusarium oxysporum TaxID=5507 RepID=A0A0J9VRT9_FUSO4|nr:hypothetical protein FOXG_12896 [Fusarium oxysporum f. sp. lycopersici 4287]KNB13380.1 hypothetical protein FOXG_12896 [Fusarium oxysporum f. sp. lycopersici 4287]